MFPSPNAWRSPLSWEEVGRGARPVRELSLGPKGLGDKVAHAVPAGAVSIQGRRQASLLRLLKRWCPLPTGAGGGGGGDRKPCAWSLLVAADPLLTHTGPALGSARAELRGLGPASPYAWGGMARWDRPQSQPATRARLQSCREKPFAVCSSQGRRLQKPVFICSHQPAAPSVWRLGRPHGEEDRDARLISHGGGKHSKLSQQLVVTVRSRSAPSGHLPQSSRRDRRATKMAG